MGAGGGGMCNNGGEEEFRRRQEREIRRQQDSLKPYEPGFEMVFIFFLCLWFICSSIYKSCTEDGHKNIGTVVEVDSDENGR